MKNNLIPIFLILALAFIHEANAGKIIGTLESSDGLMESNDKMMVIPINPADEPMDRKTYTDEQIPVNVSDKKDEHLEAINGWMDRVAMSGNDRGLFDWIKNTVKALAETVKAVAETVTTTAKELWNKVRSTEQAAEIFAHCSVDALDLVNSVNVEEVKAMLGLKLKNGMKKDDLKTIKDAFPTGKLDRFAQCLSQTGDERSFQIPTAFSLSLTGSAAVADVSGSSEIGIAFDKNGKIIGFLGVCHGPNLSTEPVSVEGALVIGFWNELGSIPGTSFTTGLSVATPGINVGCGVDIVWSKDSGYIGTTISIIAGTGVPAEPIDVSYSGLVCEDTCIAGDC